MKERMFRVICLNVSGHSNKIYYHNEVVPESAFHKGHADKYVASKHIEEVVDEPGEVTPKPPLVPEEPIVVTPPVVPPTETIKPPKKKNK